MSKLFSAWARRACATRSDGCPLGRCDLEPEPTSLRHIRHVGRRANHTVARAAVVVPEVMSPGDTIWYFWSSAGVMNAKARALDMVATHFHDPTGLSADNVSTARDLVKNGGCCVALPFDRRLHRTSPLRGNHRYQNEVLSKHGPRRVMAGLARPACEDRVHARGGTVHYR
jgi:hypothetical protein